MPNFAANLSFLWTEAPFLDRFALAAAAGFQAVEYHFPYAFSATDIRQRLDACKLTPVLHNLSAGDAAKGDFGIACLPGREAEFRASVAEAIDYALKLGTPRCNCLAGKLPADIARRHGEEILVANLKYAGTEFAKAGLTLMVEPLNSIDTPGFLVDSSSKAMAILDRVALDNVRLQYDLYHMHMMGDDLPVVLQRLLPAIGHIQFADAPGRHEPGSGGLDFTSLFAHIDALGYRGWVSAEYRPRSSTAESLGWFKPRPPEALPI